MKNRKTLEIRNWMLKKNIKQSEIERATGMDKSTISRTIYGERNCRAVLKYLLDKGCPVGILDLPEDMREAA